MKPHRGTLILVLGILSLVICQPIGIFTWIMGNSDLKEMDAGTMDPTGRSLTNAGRIIGIVALAFLAVTLVVMVLAFALGMVGAATTIRAQ